MIEPKNINLDMFSEEKQYFYFESPIDLPIDAKLYFTVMTSKSNLATIIYRRSVNAGGSTDEIERLSVNRFVVKLISANTSGLSGTKYYDIIYEDSSGQKYPLFYGSFIINQSIYKTGLNTDGLMQQYSKRYLALISENGEATETEDTGFGAITSTNTATGTYEIESSSEFVNPVIITDNLGYDLMIARIIVNASKLRFYVYDESGELVNRKFRIEIYVI